MQVALVSHQSLSPPQNYKVEVQVDRTGTHLSLEFKIIGDLTSLLLPSLNSKPNRLDDLWKHTCFEAFLAPNQHHDKDLYKDPRYWELNVSPSGDWNLYSFSDYRLGQSFETRVHKVTHEILESTSICHRSKISIDLSDFLPETPLSLGLAAVMEHRDLSKDYWAVRHCSKQPDFHVRESFLP